MVNVPRCLVRGSINVDEYFDVKDIARPGETISSHGLAKRAGGKGANQAVAVAKAGGQADFVGAVGEDGLWTLDHLSEHGVNIAGSERVSELTGRALIQVAEDGENSIILFKGANYAKLPKKPIHPLTTHLLLQNEISLDESLFYLSEAASLSLVTIFNPSPMPTTEELKSFPWYQLTWLIVNEGEAADMYRILISRTNAEQETDVQAYTEIPAYSITRKLLSQMPTTNVVCTLGGRGVLALLPSLRDSGGLPEPIYLPAAKLDKGVVDTTGAGDCFAGYMAAGLMNLQQEKGTKLLSKQDVIAVMTRCVQAAGLCVQKPGAMASIPLGTEVDIETVNLHKSMPPKRCSSPPLDRDSRAAKRRRTSISNYEKSPIRKSYSLPNTPFSYQYAFPEDSNPSTPYPPFPSDSPSNPFGRRRSLAPLLPPSTPFGRHVVLRFRFFRHGEVIDSRGVYRVTQVPLSYNFRHLKTLVAFLFGGQSGMDDEEDGEKGHLFEVKKNVEMWSRSYRHGAIKRGKTITRLSSVCDPYRYKDEWDFDDASWEIGRDDEDEEREEEIDELQEDNEPKWEAEEDYTLEHVWNSPEDESDEGDSAPRLKPVAIVYFYTPASNPQRRAQVHITLEDTPAPPRKGRGNTPTVFRARGHVYLCPIPEDEPDEWEDEDWEVKLSPNNWNSPPKAFTEYMRRTSSLPPPTLYKHSGQSTASLTSTPGLEADYSSSPPKSSPFPSTPFSIGRAVSMDSLGSSSISPAPKRLFGVFPERTPALPLAQRKRTAYITKRIERSRQRTKSRPRKKDEIEDSKERERLREDMWSGVRDRNPDGEAVDQLVSEGDDETAEEEEQAKEKDDRKTIRVRGANGVYMTLEEAMLLVVDEQEV
ncbi:hypothetical protein E1B28_013422 [Marasmius oreades]|uniref:Ribokinase n=1 Tax=Marasmius oreades TaxID=181124 RepID=A0A9P7RQK8_9AGAR|nr:uncharacterized protein E1B28_013422 [Marasmius oreades]KAG7087456.1 hypothetical protein E1B28_013422 [Marasmius oreades]